MQFQKVISYLREEKKKISVFILGLLGAFSVGVFGFSAATGFTTQLSTSISSTATTLPVVSIRDKSGTNLSMSNLGTYAFFNLEPGTSREEIVACNYISATSTYFGGCTRGLAFQGNSITASSTLQKAHNAGTAVVMSNVHYVYDQLVDKDSTETVNGLKTFGYGNIRIGDGTASTTNFGITAYNGTTNGYFKYDNINQRWIFSDDGSSNVILNSLVTGGLTASSTLGVIITDSKIGVKTFSSSGLKFNSSGIYMATSSASGGNAIGIDSTGLLINASTTAYSGLTFDSNGFLAFSNQVNSLTALGNITTSNGVFQATTANATSSFSVVSVTQAAALPTIWAAPTSPSSATTTLTGNFQINGNIGVSGNLATSLGDVTHILYGEHKNGQGNTVLAHGLGVTPARVRIFGHSSSSAAITFEGLYDGTRQYSTYNCITGTTYVADIDTSRFVLVPRGDLSCGSEYGHATISVDSTNVTLNWTDSGATYNSVFIIEASK